MYKYTKKIQKEQKLPLLRFSLDDCIYLGFEDERNKKLSSFEIDIVERGVPGK